MPTRRDPIAAQPAPVALAAAGLQHVLSMVAGAIAVPLLVGGALRLAAEQQAFLVNAALFACGIATLLQSVGFWRIGVRLPVLMGLAFAGAAPLVAVATGGVTLNGLFGAVMVAGLFAVAVAPFAGQLRRYFPPLVSGTIVTMIGITLLRIGINWAGGGAAAKNFGDPANLAIVALVVVTILVVNRLFTGLIAQLAVLLGLGIGYVVAMAFGMVDFLAVREASWVALVYPFRFGAPAFEAGAVLSLCVVMLVVMIESSGLLLALGEICARRIGPLELGSGLAAVGLGTLIAGLCNSFPVGAVAQNVGLVGVSGVRSRWAAAAAGGILVAIGSLPKLGALVASIPQPVLGGAALVLFGMLAATGIKILAGVDFAPRHNLLIVAVSIAVGLIPLAAPTFFAQAPRLLAPLFNSGVTLAALSAALLNAWFNGGAASADAPRR